MCAADAAHISQTRQGDCEGRRLSHNLTANSTRRLLCIRISADFLPVSKLTK